MEGYDYPVSAVLDRVLKAAAVSIVDFRGEGEWFLLSSDELEDHQLYNRLKTYWNFVVGNNPEGFALIHCRTGKDNGVWLHYFPDEDTCDAYLPGCHCVPVW